MGREETGRDRSAWDRAVELLRRRDRSEAQLRAHLVAAAVADNEVEAVIARLHAHHYLDDVRYAVHVAERLAARGHGSERARRDLDHAGVAADVIEAAIAQFYGAEDDLARQALARFPEPRSDRERARAARFLHGRGFPEGVVLAILGEG